MNRRLYRAIIPLVIAVSFPSPAPAAEAISSCIDWRGVMAQSELNTLPEGKVVLVQSLVDQTKQKGDEWMSEGLRDFLMSLMRSGQKIRILGGLTAHTQAASSPDFVVTGSFQHIEGHLRVFVTASAGSGELLKQFAVDVPYPDHREFFTLLADTCSQLLKLFGAKENSDVLESVRDATESTRCYENYAKGRQALSSFSPQQREVATVWFEQAKRDDYRSPLGYQGMIDLNTFLGLYFKQLRKPFAPYYQQAESELNEMARLVKHDPAVPSLKKKPAPTKKTEPRIPFDNRFLKAHALFLQGLHAAQIGNLKDSAKALEESTRLVSEDAMTWYHLSRTLNQMGKGSQATAALSKATTLNPCLEQIP